MTKSILKALQQQSSSMAFRNPVLDRFELAEAVQGSVAILRRAQADCLDREIPEIEIKDALEFLGDRNEKAAAHGLNFRKGLKIPDQAQRFEATSQALTLIERCFSKHIG